jgi:tRNA modification GTPase
MYDTHDTICAIATPAGGAARGIVRVSGPDAVRIVAECFSADDGQPLANCRHASAVAGQVSVDLRAGQSAGCRVPCDLYLWPNTRSYTRQPLAELHTIGSRPLVEAVLAALCRSGARLAEPGEFTLRAFLAGRIDLTQAEAVLGVIDARGDDELSAALSQLTGGLARPLTQLRDDLLQLLAELEAGLDFVDEDIRFIAADELLRRLQRTCQVLAHIDKQMVGRQTAQQLDQVVLVGPPNAGKSSLFNALVARLGGSGASEVNRPTPALVSPRRGTTRDYLTARIRLGRVDVELVDTAGTELMQEQRPPANENAEIQAAAQSLTDERRERAAIRVWCVDATGREIALAGGEEATPFSGAHDLVVITKSDLVAPAGTLPKIASCLLTSSVTGQGIDELCRVLGHKLSSGEAGQSPCVLASTAERCRESIRLANEAARRAEQVVREGGGDELAAAEIRTAIDGLGKIVGAVYTDDLLDRIFSTFCIGK